MRERGERARDDRAGELEQERLAVQQEESQQRTGDRTDDRMERVPHERGGVVTLGRELEQVEDTHHDQNLPRIEIAERAGVSKPVLYQHFPGKLELYLALLDSSCDTVMDAVRQALASTDDNKERVAATMEAFGQQ